jgi:hypothetical protein
VITPTLRAAPRMGADLLVKSLEAQGVEYVFVLGAKIDKMFDTLVDSRCSAVYMSESLSCDLAGSRPVLCPLPHNQ